MRVGIVVVAAVAWLTSGCGRFLLRSELPCPKALGPQWTKYQSRHFEVTTDLEDKDAARLVEYCERTYRSFLEVTGWHFPGHGEPPGRMRIVTFTRLFDYYDVGPPGSDAFFTSRAFDGVPMIVMNLSGTHAANEVFLHELTHRMLRYYVPNAPLWLHEGLAEFYSTFGVDEKKGEVVVGAATRRAAGAYRLQAKMPTFQQLWTWESRRPSTMDGDPYVGGWYLVHWLMQHRRVQLGEALVRMANGEPHEAAFTASFGPTVERDLEAGYRDIVATAHIGSWRSRYTPPSGEGAIESQRRLSDGEVHLLWADLAPTEKMLEEQLHLAETHGDASSAAELHFMRGLYHARKERPTAAEHDLSVAVDEQPDNELYRAALASRRLQNGVELHWNAQEFAALDDEMRALDEHATTARSLLVVGLHYAQRGRLADARQRLTHALDIEPTSTAICAALASVALRLGDVEGGFDLAERALHVAPDGADTTELVAQLDQARKLRDLRRQRMSGAQPAAVH